MFGRATIRLGIGPHSSLFVCLCTVADFSAAKKHMGVKFYVHGRLLSGMSFFHFDELWLAGSHSGGITSGMYAAGHWSHAAAPGEARWGFGIGDGVVA